MSEQHRIICDGHLCSCGSDACTCQKCGERVCGERVEWRPDITGNESAGNVCQSCLLQPLTDIHVQLTGRDSDAFFIMGTVKQALRRGGRGDLVDAFLTEATSGDYYHLLATCMKYVHVD